MVLHQSNDPGDPLLAPPIQADERKGKTKQWWWKAILLLTFGFLIGTFVYFAASSSKELQYPSSQRTQETFDNFTIDLNSTGVPKSRKYRTPRRNMDLCVKNNIAVFKILSGGSMKCVIQEISWRPEPDRKNTIKKLKCLLLNSNVVKDLTQSDVIRCELPQNPQSKPKDKKKTQEHIPAPVESKPLQQKRPNSESVDDASRANTNNNKLGQKIDNEQSKNNAKPISNSQASVSEDGTTADLTNLKTLVGKTILAPRENAKPIEAIVKEIVSNDKIKVGYTNEQNLHRVNTIAVKDLIVLNPQIFKEMGYTSRIQSSQQESSSQENIIPLWDNDPTYLEYVKNRQQFLTSTEKPKYTWVKLCQLAFIDKREKLLSVDEISTWIAANFYFHRLFTQKDKLAVTKSMKDSNLFHRYDVNNQPEWNFINMGQYTPPTHECERTFYEPAGANDYEFIDFHEALKSNSLQQGKPTFSYRTMATYVFYDLSKSHLSIADVQKWLTEHIPFFATMDKVSLRGAVIYGLGAADNIMREGPAGNNPPYTCDCSFPSLDSTPKFIAPAGVDAQIYLKQKRYNEDFYGLRTPEDTRIYGKKQIENFFKKIAKKPRTTDHVWLSKKFHEKLNNDVAVDQEPHYVYCLATDLNNLKGTCIYYGLTMDPQSRCPSHRKKFPLGKLFFMVILNDEQFSGEVAACFEHVLVRLGLKGKIRPGNKLLNKEYMPVEIFGPNKMTTTCNDPYFTAATTEGHADYDQLIRAVNDWVDYGSVNGMRVHSDRIGYSERQAEKKKLLKQSKIASKIVPKS